MKINKLFAFLLATVMLMTCLTACDGKGKTRATTTGQKDNSLSIAMTNKITTLDPQLYTSMNEDAVLFQIYDTLFRYDNENNIVYFLLESMTENEDGSVDMVLKNNVTFHSGDILKAEDVAYTLSRGKNSPMLSPLFGVVDVEIHDDTHFTLNFPAAAEGLNFGALGFNLSAMYIVNKSFCEDLIADPNEKIGFVEDGTGPYCFKEMAVNGDLVLTRYDGYYGKASIDTLNFKVISGNHETAFEAGNIDFSGYSKPNYELIRGYDNVATEEYTRNHTVYLFVNCLNDLPTADLRVRQAIAYCLNREELVLVGGDGAGIPAHNMFNPKTVGYTEIADKYKMDVKKANSLMTDAGYSKSNPLMLELVVISAQPNWVAACEILKEQLEKSYFSVSINEIMDSSRVHALDYDLAFSALSMPPTIWAHSCLFDASTGLNLAGVNNPELLAMFKNASDPVQEKKIQEIATDVLSYIPLYYTVAFAAYDDNLNIGGHFISYDNYMYSAFSWKK